MRRGKQLILRWRLRYVLALSLSVLSSALVSAQVPFAAEPPGKSDVREAIFRSMFKRYNYGSYVKVFCIQPETAQPQRFLNRFANVKPHVVWASDCDNSGRMMSVREKSSGDSGMRMSIEEIEWMSGNEAEAKLEAFSDGIAANWNTLRVVFRAGIWVVKADKLTGVS